MLIDIKGQSNDVEGMEQILETMKAEDMEPDSRIQVRSYMCIYNLPFLLLVKQILATIMKRGNSLSTFTVTINF